MTPPWPVTLPRPDQISPHVRPGAPGQPKQRLSEMVERHLRDEGVPYICVDEAKRALFGGAKLRSFHFVVYQTKGKNWLLHAASLTPASRNDLRQCEEIFGDGFIGVVASFVRNGNLKFRTLAGLHITFDCG
jgi:hypothetical protein